jgi:hypothetical protein
MSRISTATINVPLTTYAQGIMQDRLAAYRLANLLCPIVPVTAATGSFKIFDDRNSFLAEDMSRPVGGPRKRLAFDATDGTYACKPFGVEIPVDDFEVDLAGGQNPVASQLTAQGKLNSMLSRKATGYAQRVTQFVFANLTAVDKRGNFSNGDVDPIDQPFFTGERTVEGFYRSRNGIDQAISRGLAYAEYADLIWCETGTPDIDEARKFAESIHAQFPGKLLAYNCSPSFNWKRALSDEEIAKFQHELGELGYKFQFITLAGFHALNASMFELAKGYAESGMTAYVALQESEFGMEDQGYTATRHQREVGAGYFDLISTIASAGASSTLALKGSTEEEQFH